MLAWNPAGENTSIPHVSVIFRVSQKSLLGSSWRLWFQNSLEYLEYV